MIIVSIDVTKIDKTHLKPGKPRADGSIPKYLDIVLMEVDDDKYGNDFRANQGVSKEDREAGVRGAILGNAKHVGRKSAQKSAPQQQQRPADPELDAADEDDVPF